MLVTSLNPLPQLSADSLGQCLSELHLQPCHELLFWNFVPCCGSNGYKSNILPTGARTHESPNEHRWPDAIGHHEDDFYRLNVNTWWVDSWSLWAGVMQSDVSWVSAVPLMLPNCPSVDKESLQMHQQHWDEATLLHINHAHQKLIEAKTRPTVSTSSFNSLHPTKPSSISSVLAATA